MRGPGKIIVGEPRPPCVSGQEILSHTFLAPTTSTLLYLILLELHLYLARGVRGWLHTA